MSSDYKTLKQWLSKSNCQHHYSKFADNNITFDLLLGLDSAALKEIGINKLGDRLKLEIAISSLKSEKLLNSVSVDEMYKLMNLNVTDLDSSITQKDLYTNDVNNTSSSSNLIGSTTDKDSSKNVTFILQDGSTKRVNVTGCFNAQSIKRKVLKRLGIKQQETSYDTYIHSSSSNNSSGIVVLFDVELVTICFSPDRVEKHRIMLCPKNEYPSNLAIEASRRIAIKYERFEHDATLKLVSHQHLRQFHIPDRKADSSTMRNFFGQRPPSELISSNLAEYFPDTAQHDLEATVRNSVRYSVRLSRRFNFPQLSSKGSSNISVDKRNANLSVLSNGSPSLRSIDVNSGTNRKQNGRTIGDIMVNNAAAVEEVFNPNDYQSTLNKPPSISLNASFAEDSKSINSSSSRGTTQKRISIAASFSEQDNKNNRHSRIELMNIDSDSDDADEFLDDYATFTGEDADKDSYHNFDLASDGGPKNWLKGARIGAGSFGTVYLGMNPITGELIAVKQVSLPDKNSAFNSSQKSIIEALQHEMSLLKELNHENIVRYLGSSTDDEYLNIFLEYVPGGSVQSMLLSYGPFEEPLIRNFIRQVLIGLSYLHCENIIHRDIKGANILIDIKGTVKISDFGISKRVGGDMDNDKRAKRASLQGSVYWMAPEVVKQTAYTKKADIWSVGCVIVEMFTGKHPFPNFSQMQAIFKIGTHITPQIPEWCTLEAKEFLSKTFELDYEKRPDAVDLLAEQFLNPLIMSKD